MTGQRLTRERIARLFLDSGDLVVEQLPTLSADTEYALGTRSDFETWVRKLPELGRSAIFDPSGQVVLALPAAPRERTPAGE
jgi:hypothetical protein